MLHALPHKIVEAHQVWARHRLAVLYSLVDILLYICQ
jgi:hypothetical protein